MARPPIPLGYEYGGMIDVEFDGGNHEIRGSLLQCTRCWSLIHYDRASDHTDYHITMNMVIANVMNSEPFSR